MHYNCLVDLYNEQVVEHMREVASTFPKKESLIAEIEQMYFSGYRAMMVKSAEDDANRKEIENCLKQTQSYMFTMNAQKQMCERLKREA